MKNELSERDICTKYITPALDRAGWALNQFREEVDLTTGRVVFHGEIAHRVTNREAKGSPKRINTDGASVHAS